LGRRRDWRNWTDRQSARHPAGHTCIAIAGPTERAITLRTGNPGRCQNMEAFATRALELLGEIIPSV
jgi:nicotinamide mononucleotide (NMN) deamidase PncC